MPTEYTERDVTTAVREYRALEGDITDDMATTSVTAVFSFGYGYVWADGEVTAFGRVVFQVDEDGEVA